MPKGRHLKPDFFTDKRIVTVSPLARLLYQGLWCYAADCGHLDDEPVEFKMRILPADSCDVNQLLNELAAEGRIERVDGVIHLPTLRRHGRVDKRYETLCDACKARNNHTVTTTGPRSDHDVTTRAGEANTTVMVMVSDGDGDGDRAPLAPTPKPRTRGTRIPDSFTVTDAMRAWVAEQGLTHLDLELITDEFIDYWRGVPGQKGVRLDWVGTWRNRVRVKAEDAKVRPIRNAVHSEDRLWNT